MKMLIFSLSLLSSLAFAAPTYERIVDLSTKDSQQPQKDFEESLKRFGCHSSLFQKSDVEFEHPATISYLYQSSNCEIVTPQKTCAAGFDTRTANEQTICVKKITAAKSKASGRTGN